MITKDMDKGDIEKRRGCGQLFTVDVNYFYDPGGSRDNDKYDRINIGNNLYRNRNMMAGELMSFRDTIFTAGLMVEWGTGHWLIIRPDDIKSVEVFLQKKYFE
jgi:GT2 family glycosyltransferase